MSASRVLLEEEFQKKTDKLTEETLDFAGKEEN